MSSEAMPTSHNPNHESDNDISLSSETRNNAEIIDFSKASTEVATESSKVWPLLDSRMSQTDIMSAVQAWNPSRVYHGKQNTDRSQAAVEWILVQAHVSVDTAVEKDLRDKLVERDRRKAKGLTLSQAQRKLPELTPAQIEKLEIAQVVNQKMRVAEKRIETEKERGMSHLLDFIEDLEAYVLEECADANVVRLFNAVDDKTGGRNTDFILARRTIVVMLANELHTDTNR